MLCYICVQSFIILGMTINWLAHFIDLIIMFGLGLWFGCFLLFTLNNIVYKPIKNNLVRPVIDSNLFAEFHLHTLPGFWGMLVKTGQER